MDVSEVLYTVIYSNNDFDLKESSAEGSEDKKDGTPNLLDPLSSAEVKFYCFVSTILYNHAVY